MHTRKTEEIKCSNGLREEKNREISLTHIIFKGGKEKHAEILHSFNDL